ncbi:amidohydrolase family protein [Nonomuraea antimicrobica]
MTPFDLVVRSRRTVTPEESGPPPSPYGEKIAALYDHAAPLAATEDIDLRDLALLPGLVDTHVHVNEPGRAHWEGFASATRAAAAGGVTTIVDMPLNSIPRPSAPRPSTRSCGPPRKCHVDVGFWGGAVPGNVKDLAPLHERGVHGFKCFMSPSGVEEFPPLSVAELRVALEEVAGFGGLMVVHAEDPALLAEPGGPGYREFLDSRPGAAERSAVETVVRLAEETGCRVHILHVSGAECLDVLEAARAGGVAVTAETCPHYLTLAAEQVPEGRRRTSAARPSVRRPTATCCGTGWPGAC